MENYVKAAESPTDPDADWQSDWLEHFGDVCDTAEGTSVVKVKAGSSLGLLNGYAAKQLGDEKTQRVIFRGLGPSCTKAVSCAEVLKRDHDHTAQPLHQVNRIVFKRFEEIWEPQIEHLDRLRVNRDVPMIFIMLSKLPVDPSTTGYQPANAWTAGESRFTSKSRNKARKPVGSGKNSRNQWRRQDRRREQGAEIKAARRQPSSNVVGDGAVSVKNDD